MYCLKTIKDINNPRRVLHPVCQSVGWDVLAPGGRKLETVYFTADCDADYVRRSLIDHDGFPGNIRVVLNR